MKIKDCSSIISEKVNCSEFDTLHYISTENMLPNLGGIVPSERVPSGQATAFRQNDILLSNIRPYFRKLYFSEIKGGCSNDVICLRPSKNKVLPRYLYYALSSEKFFSYYVTNCKGTKMPRGDKSALLNYILPQYSFNQQQHIVDVSSST